MLHKYDFILMHSINLDGFQLIANISMQIACWLIERDREE
jgi:hypothetical protein